MNVELVKVNSRSLMNFCRDLAGISEIGAGRNFGIDNLQCKWYWNAHKESTDIK